MIGAAPWSARVGTNPSGGAGDGAIAWIWVDEDGSTIDSEGDVSAVRNEIGDFTVTLHSGGPARSVTTTHLANVDASSEIPAFVYSGAAAPGALDVCHVRQLNRLGNPDDFAFLVRFYG